VNSYYYTWHAPDDKPQWHKTKNVHIWARDAEGDWKLRVDIWNSDVRVADFADE
jgi:ketosteroid isomerase-like protein